MWTPNRFARFLYVSQIRSNTSETDDSAVSRKTALDLLDHLEVEDMHLTLIKDGDHSLSTPENLMAIQVAIEDVLGRVA